MKVKAYERNMMIPIDSEGPSQALAENFYLYASDSFISKTLFPVRTASGFTNKTVVCFLESDLIPVFATCQRTLINNFSVKESSVVAFHNVSLRGVY